MCANAANAFLRLCRYKHWIARRHRLSSVISGLVLASGGNQDSPDYVMASKPIPVCHAFFGKTTKGWFFGFKLHALVNNKGWSAARFLRLRRGADRDPALALDVSVESGVALGDLGYRGEELRDWLETEATLLFLTPANTPKPQKALLRSFRKRVETSFSQRWSGFVDLVYSRSWNGLWNTVKWKMLQFK